MPWPNNIEQWRQYVRWESRDIPEELVLAIIKHESNGQAGAPGQRETKAGNLPTRDGSSIKVNRALGLMQVIPGTILAYNEKHSDEPVFLEDMLGTDERSARLQIRVGSSVFANKVRALYRYDSKVFPGYTPGKATSDQLILALTAYAHGFGNLKPKLDYLRERGIPLTFANVAQAFPNWGKVGDEWINRPLHYARTVWTLANKYGNWQPPIPSNKPGLPQLAKNEFVIPLLLAALAFFLKKRAKEAIT